MIIDFWHCRVEKHCIMLHKNTRGGDNELLFVGCIGYMIKFMAKKCGVQNSSNLVLQAWNECIYIGLHGQEWLPQATVYLGIFLLKATFAV